MNRMLKAYVIGMTWALCTTAAVPSDQIDSEERSQSAEKDARDAEARADEQELYEEGTDALDDSEWEDAVAAFTKVSHMNGVKVDGALYWRAYALKKLGRRPEALASLEELQRSHPSSRWLKDAKALDVEIRQSGGRSVSPDSESDDEIKLIALNGLLNMDSDKAVPMLEKFLQGNNSARLKEQALFVLVQGGSSRARDIVFKIARGDSNPDLQRKALEYLGIFGDDETHGALKEIYASSTDVEVKRAILEGFMASGDEESLLAAARTEKNPDLRRKAIELLGAQGASAQLQQLYRSETDPEVREKIIQSLALCDEPGVLVEIGRNEKDARLRRVAVQSLGLMDPDETGQALKEFYTTDKDLEVKKAVIEALMIQDNATTLIALARKETNPALRKEIVEKLSVMDSKEGTEFLLEILNK